MKIRMFIFICIINYTCMSCNTFSSGLDYKLFNNTPVKDLAIAVQNEDVEEINILVKEKKMNVNFKEPKFGYNLLMLAVVGQKPEIIETLLKLGANPNQRNNRKSKSAFTLAVEYSSVQDCDTNKIKMLLKYGADVNAKWVDFRETKAGNIQDIQETVLMIACENGCINVVKVLLENGANIDEYTKHEGYGAITNCLIYDNIDIAKYLIIDKNAKIPDYVLVLTEEREYGSSSKKVTITDILNSKNYDSDPANQNAKKQILEYLNKIGKE